jgi:hypothetical protein
MMETEVPRFIVSCRALSHLIIFITLSLQWHPPEAVPMRTLCQSVYILDSMCNLPPCSCTELFCTSMACAAAPRLPAHRGWWHAAKFNRALRLCDDQLQASKVLFSFPHTFCGFSATFLPVRQLRECALFCVS